MALVMSFALFGLVLGIDIKSEAKEALQTQLVSEDNTEIEGNQNTIYDGKDYSAVYDYEYYISKYADLKKIYGNDEKAVLKHFVNYGMKEGRQAKETFDVKSYKNRYRDLRNAYGNNLKMYYMHYINYGQREGRKATGTVEIQAPVTVYNGIDYSAVYDYNYYINKYADLKKAYDGDDVALLKHFVNYGMKEGRQAKESFDVKSYRSKYQDLRIAYGTDLKKYYLHYINYGVREGRQATGTVSIQNPITTFGGMDYSAVYDYNYYINKYADLKKTYDGDDVALLKHFVNHGMRESRQAKETFNASYYKGNYADLQNAYGNNLKDYYMHYIRYGQNEGREAVANLKWVLKQYADDSGRQGMFYTLKNTTDGTLIIIDGGNPENEEQVRRIIMQEGGVVTAWFLTHYHPDHIGAFNAIYHNPKGIVINSIYATPYNQELFTSIAQYWDGIESFETFVEATAEDARVNYIKRDFVFKYKDMSITFFNCFDNLVLEQVNVDILNNASLVFKVETEKNSILFCGDCNGNRMADLLINRYGVRLRADYVQLGHHGNASLPTRFYDMVQPDAVFFDAPKWLMSGEKYDAKELADYFRKQGISCYDYTTAPNCILLY